LEVESGWVLAIVSVLAIAGQGINLLLNLTLRNKVLEMERSVMDRVDAKYKLREVCASEMESVESRSCPLGQSCPLAMRSAG
jgi:hypothetical protein